MRIFAAVVPPTGVLEHLEDAVAPRREAGSELRWTDPHQWHVTLAFMPDVPSRAVDPLVERVSEAVVELVPPRLALASAGAFPDPTAARVLWTGVTGDDLTPLARRVRSAANRAGAAPDGGELHPHVTLARFPRPAEATRWLRALEPYAGPAWTAGEVTLIASHLGEGRGRRPRYEELATAPLLTPTRCDPGRAETGRCTPSPSCLTRAGGTRRTAPARGSAPTTRPHPQPRPAHGVGCHCSAPSGAAPSPWRSFAIVSRPLRRCSYPSSPSSAIIRCSKSAMCAVPSSA